MASLAGVARHRQPPTSPPIGHRKMLLPLVATCVGIVLITAVGALVVLQLGQTARPPEVAPTWPTTGWYAGTPEDQGFDSGKLADALEAIHQKHPNIHSLLLVRNGSLVVDATFYPYDGSTPHDLASVTKSLTTALLGIAIDQGKLRRDDSVLSFFPERTVANRDPRKERMTVGHLASMTSGLDCVGPPADPDEPTLVAVQASPDWVQFTLDLPMTAEPGTTFSYCSPGMHLLSAILTKVTGLSALDFARQTPLRPTGHS